MGKNLAEVQTAETRIASATSSKKVVTTTTTQVVDPADLAVNGELTDARDFNSTWANDPHATAVGLPFQVFDYMTPGTTLRDKPVFGYTGDWDSTRPGDNNVQTQLDMGRNVLGWEDGIITWGFYDFRSKVGPNSSHEGKGYFPFTDAQKAAAVESIAAWDDLIAPDFVLKDYNGQSARDWAHNEIDILLANTTTGPAQAWAYYPDQPHAYKRASSDVWIGAATNNLTDLYPGGYGINTQVHELGHTLGLSHPGQYNFGSGGPITYEGSAFYFQDNRQYSIMSYFDQYEVGSNVVDYNLMRIVYQSTPMVDDVWVIQRKYGAETHTRTGDTTYGFNATGDITNEALKFNAGDAMTMFTIWDAGGHDTLDLSGYHTPSVIDLREGAYSSAGGFGAYGQYAGVDPSTIPVDDYMAFVNANNEALGLPSRTGRYDLYFGGRTGVNEGVAWSDINGRDWLMENNIGIAYGAIIEDAKGGYGNDRINGNQAVNHFWGNGGADTFVIADYTRSNVPDPTAASGSKSVTDNSVDYVMDFNHAEGDKIDLASFGHNTVSNVSYDGSDLLTFTANGHNYAVHVLGSGFDVNTDIVYG